MAELTKQTLFHYMETGMIGEAKRIIIDKLVAETLKDFERMLRDRIKDEMEGLIVTSVKNATDMMKMRDELHIYIKWNEEEAKEIT